MFSLDAVFTGLLVVALHLTLATGPTCGTWSIGQRMRRAGRREAIHIAP